MIMVMVSNYNDNRDDSNTINDNDDDSDDNNTINDDNSDDINELHSSCELL